jgi:hypothetical protein
MKGIGIYRRLAAKRIEPKLTGNQISAMLGKYGFLRIVFLMIFGNILHSSYHYLYIYNQKRRVA